MNRAHRIADQVRSVVGFLNRVPTESQFLSKGLLTPAEFVEAGEQLVFQCPSWQWQGCNTRKKQVFWLPPMKQYLLTRNIPCRHRVTDWERSFCKNSHVNSEGWLVPGHCSDDHHRDSSSAVDTGEGPTCLPQAVPPTKRSVEFRVKRAGGDEWAVRHAGESSENEEDEELDENDNDDDDGSSVRTSPDDRGLQRARLLPEMTSEGKDNDDSKSDSFPTNIGDTLIAKNALKTSGPAGTSDEDFVEVGASSDAMRKCDDSCEDGDFMVIGGGSETTHESADQLVRNQNLSNCPQANKLAEHNSDFQSKVPESRHSVQNQRTRRNSDWKSATIPTRSYDLSITYDKYYQSPRLWLFGYDESGVPLRAEAVFEDIHSDYLSKTVTVDPHPFTGVPTVSVHPCKHASVMRNVAQSWLRSGINPRHDLALFVLLKMVSSVVPTINYDFTIDIVMPIGISLRDAVVSGPEGVGPAGSGEADDRGESTRRSNTKQLPFEQNDDHR